MDLMVKDYIKKILDLRQIEYECGLIFSHVNIGQDHLSGVGKHGFL